MTVTDTRGFEGRAEVTIPARTLGVDPGTTRPRTLLTVSGRNFIAANPDGSHVAIDLAYDCGGSARRTVGTEPDTSGGFASTLRVPDGCGIPSTNTINAIVEVESTWTLKEMVTHDIPEAEIAVTPDRAAVGQAISVTGLGFRPFERVVSMTLGPTDILGSREEYTDREGHISITGLTVADISPGWHVLVVEVGEGAGRTAARVSLEVEESSSAGAPTDDCGQTLTGDGSIGGLWADGCESETRGGRYARYYTFTLAQEWEVTITLESADADTYLYLREGESRSGNFLHDDDDSPDTTRSQIQETLAAGSYTIEATTYWQGETGSFTLTVSGLVTTGTTPPAGTSTTDRETLVALYNATDGPNWTVSTGWLTYEPLNEWYGVSVDSSSRVIELSLLENQATSPSENGTVSQQVSEAE